ncbi:sensor histidine kinase [Nonomuraea sp. C10]|uniref:sensor histidine kinase n=1 Tax=Nonomuraea sp. C10 TaxID=2600577 RepID=UPI0021C33D24|nr:histidine kinase [Nonomuraea sp. C10]
MNRVALGAGLAFLVGLALIESGARIDRGVPDWVLAIPLAITCLAVLLRYRSPLGSLGLGTVGVVLDLFVGPSLGTVLVYTDNLYAAALYGPARFSRWLLVITTVAAVGTGAVTGFLWADWRALALTVVQLGLILVTPVTTAHILRQHRDQAAAERARAEQVARLAELDRQAAITSERTRMARELHDMIANHFSAIAIQSTAVLSRKDLDAATVRTIMESVRENSVQGLAEMRSMIGLLRQEGDEGEALRPRLRDAEGLVERSRQSGLATELSVDGPPRDLPAPIDLAAYRILQEALTNALKHGDSPARVHLVYEPDQVSITVDNAASSRDDRLPGAGAGLVGMKERAGLVGGTFEAGPHADGWRVSATLPAPGREAT